MSRLPPGIYRRGASYAVKVYVGRDPLTQKKRYANGSAPTLAEAKTLQATLRVEAARGQHRVASGTYAELAEQWLTVKAPYFSPKTVKETRGWLNRDILPALGHLPLSKVTTPTLDGFYAQLTQRLAPATVERIHGVVRASLELGVAYGWLPANPARHATRPTVDRPDITPPTTAELDRLERMAAEGNPDFWVFVVLAADTGARRSDLLPLRWGDIDLEQGTVSFTKALVMGVDGPVEKPRGKTSRARRKISIHHATVRALIGHRKRWQERALRVGVRLSDNAHLFSHHPDASVPWRPESPTHLFERLRERAGTPHVRLHDLRHYVATQLLADGVPDSVVGARLGHAPNTTRTIYSHFDATADRAAMETLAKRRLQKSS